MSKMRQSNQIFGISRKPEIKRAERPLTRYVSFYMSLRVPILEQDVDIKFPASPFKHAPTPIFIRKSVQLTPPNCRLMNRISEMMIAKMINLTFLNYLLWKVPICVIVEFCSLTSDEK